MKIEDLETAPLDDIDMTPFDQSTDPDGYIAAMDVINRRLAPVKREFRVRPVLHWEVTDYTVKDGGNIETETGRGVHFSLMSAVSSAQALEAQELARAEESARIFEPVIPRFQAAANAFVGLEKAVRDFNREMYGEGPPREYAHRAR